MTTIKLCTYTKSFFPYIYGQKQRIIMCMFLVIEDGKILKRSFSECSIFFAEENAEIGAFRTGLEWILQNKKNIGDINIQVIFCGAPRVEIKKKVDDGTFFSKSPDGNYYETYCAGDIYPMLLLFNKVTYSTASRVMFGGGKDDDSESARKFDMFGAVTKLFELFYGTDNGYGHPAVGGQPELRWGNGAPREVWT